MLTFEVNKQTDVSISVKWLEKTALVFARVHGFKDKRYFSLALVDNRTIKRLNRNYRGINKVTDVLSFVEDFKNFVDLPTDRKYLGEIVICVPQARRQAKQLSHSLKNEIARLLIHGLAHLTGYNHEDVSAQEAQKMFEFEEKVMKSIKQENKKTKKQEINKTRKQKNKKSRK